MNFLNGWKTYLGIAIALVSCLAAHGFSLSLATLVDCAKSVVTGQTGVGVGLGLAGVGLLHKAAKAGLIGGGK